MHGLRFTTLFERLASDVLLETDVAGATRILRISTSTSAHVSLCVLALLIERIAEIRAGATWRTIAAQLDTSKVVEYERAGARVRQTTEVRGPVADLLRKLRVPAPPRLHHIGAAPTA